MNILKRSGKKASEIARQVQPYPQVMQNVAVPNSEKKGMAQRPEVLAAIEQVQMELGEGRVLVRPSGTEALVRVMVEGKEERQVRRACDTVAGVIRALV